MGLSLAALVLSVGWSPGTASASTSAAAGYFTFGPVAFGDATSCEFQGFYAFGSSPSLFATAPVVGAAVTPDCAGGWLTTADGGVFSSAGRPFYGSAGNLLLHSPVVGIAATPDDKGYWLVAADGGVFSFGDAAFYGSTGAMTLNAGIVGMAATADGKGYWLVAADGGVFSFGDAAFYGSTGAMTLNAGIVGMAATADGKGYWLVAADGGVFSFGDAAFYGSTGGDRLSAPVTAMTAAPDGRGYWIVAADGGVFTFGDAGFYGSLASNSLAPGGSNGTDIIANPIITLIPTPSGQGYLLLPAAPGVNPTVRGGTGYALARREYQFSWSEAAVFQSVTWQQAASYLRIGQRVDPGITSGYPAATAELEQLASIPETSTTPNQDAEASADIAALTSFFNLPG